MKECSKAGGTVEAVEETVIHKSSIQLEAAVKGLVAKCSQADESATWAQEIGVVCGTCESSDWGASNYIERVDCRALDPVYPTCANGIGGAVGAPMITSDSINDLLALCRPDEINYLAMRVQPKKYGDGNEIELNAYCNNIGDFSLLPKFAVTCGHCENNTFVSSDLCKGVDPVILESEAKCFTYVQLDVEQECQPGDGGASEVGFIGEYGGNITRAVLMCCSSSNCPGETTLSGLYCGECSGPGWQEYVPYENRNCSGYLLDFFSGMSPCS